MREVITVRDCGVPSKGAPHVVQYGDTEKELMSLLRQGYQLTYYLENPPEQGKLTVSQPNREDNSGCIGCAHLDLRLDMSSDQIPADLTDYYNILFPPGIVDRPNTNPLPYYSAEVKDILQNILSAYTALLREEELNPPETTPSNTPDQVTTNPAQIIASPTNDNTPYTPGSITFNTDTFISEISPTNTTIVVLQEIDWEKLKNILQLTTTTPEMLTTTPETLSDTTETDTTVSQAPADNDTVRNIEPGLYGPGNVTVHIDPEYAKQMEEQFKNVKMRVGGCGRGQAFFRFIYDSDDAETPSGYELVRTESWSGPDCTDEQIADIARYIINNDISDEQQKALMLEAVDAFLAKEEQTSVVDGTPNYTPVTVYSQIVSPDEKEAKVEDTTTDTEQEGTPATPRIRVTITNNYARDPSSPFYDAYVMLKNSGNLILPMDGKVTVWPSDVIEYLNKNYPDWDTDSYTEEEIAALQDTYSHLLNGDYLMQGSDNNTFTDNTTLYTTNHLYSPDFIAWLRSYYRDEIAPKMNAIDSLTVEEAASFHEELNSFKEVLTQARIEIAYVLQDLSSYEDLAVMQDTIESYIASLNGNETDITGPNNYLEGPLPQSELEKLEKLRINLDNAEWKLYKFTSDDFGKLIHYSVSTDTPVAFINSIDSETEAVTSVQVACANTDGWRTIGTLNPDGIDWKYKAGNLTGSGAPSVVWHAQELGALGVWTDGTDNWTGIEGWFDANWTMLGCGDFDDDGKDSVLMSLNGGLFYSVDLDGTLAALGSLNWSGWEFGAVGDFAGDGKDDVVLYHKELGSVVLLADGNSDDWTSLGQIDGSDWAVAGAGDFNGDGIADLLVRQASTGLIGGYAGADMSRWSVVDSDAGYYLA